LRLSEAILAGSTLVKAKSGAEAYPDGSGCARGMALEAVGKRQICVEFATFQETRYLTYALQSENFEEVWPWTKIVMVVPFCKCLWWCLCDESHKISVSAMIQHIFDWHVMDRLDGRVWTLEQLVDWVRSVEPQEEEAAPVTEETTEALAKAV
jgi:hypothetical protein